MSQLGWVIDHQPQPTKAYRPQVNWRRRDLDDGTDDVNAASILRDYALAERRTPRVYQAWIPLFLLSERLWEEVENAAYDWAAYSRDGQFPPIKLEIDTYVGESMSFMHVLHIRDGNHRVRFWRACGFTEAPAWVLDYRQCACGQAEKPHSERENAKSEHCGAHLWVEMEPAKAGPLFK